MKSEGTCHGQLAHEMAVLADPVACGLLNETVSINLRENLVSFHLQPDWQRALGQCVEIWLDGQRVRTGTVESVMPDNSILWIAAEAPDLRQMMLRDDGYQVFARYEWLD